MPETTSLTNTELATETIDTLPPGWANIPPEASPMLSQPVKVRAHNTMGAGLGNQNGATTATPAPQPEPKVDPQTTTPPPKDVPGQQGGNYVPPANTNYNKPPEQPATPTTREMTFDAQPGPESGGSGGGSSAQSDPQPQEGTMELSPQQVKEFSNIAVENYNLHIPGLIHELFTKLEMGNIELHAEAGNLKPEFVKVFEHVNSKNKAIHKLEKEETGLLKRSLESYLLYKKSTIANPETAFWGTFALTLGKQVAVAIKTGKETKKLVHQALILTNPNLANSQTEVDQAKREVAKEVQTEQ